MIPPQQSQWVPAVSKTDPEYHDLSNGKLSLIKYEQCGKSHSQSTEDLSWLHSSAAPSSYLFFLHYSDGSQFHQNKQYLPVPPLQAYTEKPITTSAPTACISYQHPPCTSLSPSQLQQALKQTFFCLMKP